MTHRAHTLARPAMAALAAATVACGSPGRQPPTAGDAGPRESRLAEALYGSDAGPGPWSRRYYEGYLAETLRGDLAEAGRAYDDVVAGAGPAEPEVAARAALRLAQIEALRGRRREAVELLARASVLGQSDIEIVEQADRLQARLAQLRPEGEGAELRGPPIGATVEGATPRAQALFARAEALLRVYLRVRLQPRLEGLRAGVRAKERAMDAAHRAYLAVVAQEEPAAATAAEFRAASLYHDLALALMFDLPPELEPRAAAKLRATLRSSAIGHLRKAEAAYRRSLAVAGGDGRHDRWQAAAALGLRSVQDLLGASESVGQP